jgi:Lar family restriction alleviation protein
MRKNQVPGKRRQSIKLKPCPFCGSTQVKKGKLEGLDPLHWVACLNCGASSGMKIKRIDAIASWNIRIEKEE